jgi:hypothetical protein
VQIAALAVAQDAVYWVSAGQPGQIYRAGLSRGSPSAPEALVKSRYQTGTLSAMPIQVGGDWLVFLDQAFNANNPLWRLRALNLATGQERILDQAGGNRLARIYSFSAGDNQAAWIVQDRDPKRSCAEESTLYLADLSTGRISRVVQSCADNDRQWNAVQVSGSRILASVTLLQQGNKSQIDLWDTPESSPQALSDAFAADKPSFPALTGDWAAWQSAPGQTRIHPLSGKDSRVLISPIAGGQLVGPLLSQNWVTWLPTPDLVAYNLEKSTWQAIAAPGPGEKITQVATGGGWIAWSRESTSGAELSSQIEWAALD